MSVSHQLEVAKKNPTDVSAQTQLEKTLFYKKNTAQKKRKYTSGRIGPYESFLRRQKKSLPCLYKNLEERMNTAEGERLEIEGKVMAIFFRLFSFVPVSL